jgi:hypothetical protein
MAKRAENSPHRAIFRTFIFRTSFSAITITEEQGIVKFCVGGGENPGKVLVEITADFAIIGNKLKWESVLVFFPG